MAKQVTEQVVKLPKPLPYQKEIINWINTDVKYVTFVKSRQSGGSYLNKMLVAMWGLGQMSKKIGYITPTAKLGKLFYRELCEQLKPYISETNSTDLLIKFKKTGSNVQFFSAESKDAIRGFQFHKVIVDEAAFIDDDTFNLIIRPTFTIIGENIILTSTTNGASGFFYAHNIFGRDDSMEQYRTQFITIYDNPFISDEDREMIKRQVPDRVWRQEYMSEFLDGSGSVFSNYFSCINDNPEKTGIYYAGIDWGKTNDYTVCTIINNKKQVVDILRINSIEYTKQVEIISRKLNQWKPREVISEENNIGSVVNELLKKSYKGRIKTPYLTSAPKRDIIEDLVVAFEQNLISIPNNENLINELQSFTCTYNPQTQSVKYSAPNGLHDDMIMSLSYAYSAINKKSGGSIRIL